MATDVRYAANARGKKTAVIMSIKRYRNLLEDLHDLAVIAERQSEKPISLGEMRRRLKLR